MYGMWELRFGVLLGRNRHLAARDYGYGALGLRGDKVRTLSRL